MAIAINILENGQGIEILLSGKIMGQEIIALQTPEPAKSDFPPNLGYMLIDYTAVIESYVSHEEVAIIAENDRKLFNLLPYLIVAAVVPNEVFHLVSQLWKDLVCSEIERIKIFTHRNDAETWIAENKVVISD